MEGDRQTLTQHKQNVAASSSSTSVTPTPKILFTPSVGQHWFTYKGKRIKLERHRDAASAASGSIRESITMTIFLADRQFASAYVGKGLL